MRILFILSLLLFTNVAQAESYNYVCKDNGQSRPLKVDATKNSLTWKGGVYKLQVQEDCAKFGWHAESSTGSFDFCTATQGYADFALNGKQIGCRLSGNAR